MQSAKVIRSAYIHLCVGEYLRYLEYFVLLITIQRFEKTPGITSWVIALLYIHPSPSAVRGTSMALVPVAPLPRELEQHC